MVDVPLDRPRRAAIAVYPRLAPALRHIGRFGVFLMLAPMIGPRGYGLFMLALGGVAIAEALLVETATQALTAMPTVNGRHWSTALLTMMAGGGMIWLALRAGAPLLDALVGEPDFSDLFQSLAILPLLGGLSVVPAASLRREGREAPLLVAGLAGLVTGSGIALSLAQAGAGAWSLVAQIIVQRLVECVVLWGTPGERVGLSWSARHFTEIAEALDARAFAAVWPVVSRNAPCIVVGLALGPTAAGLYMLATWLAEALAEVCVADNNNGTPETAIRRVCRMLLPAVLGSGLLAIALPPLVDLRWWGVVPPAQVLLLGTIPAAIAYVCAAQNHADAPRWRAVEALGGVAICALLARYGLVVIAVGSLSWLSLVALAGLWWGRHSFAMAWQAPAVELLRPIGGAMVAGAFLFFLATPVGLALTPIAALSLLGGGAWLIYLVVRGDPVGTQAHAERFAPEV